MEAGPSAYEPDELLIAPICVVGSGIEKTCRGFAREDRSGIAVSRRL
jgi:hypothetical protein